MSTTTTLADFLLARIAEDEAAARETRHGTDDDDEEVELNYGGPWHMVDCGYDQIEFGRNCQCSVPARVLAECAAKRRIVELHAISLRRQWVNPVDGPAYSEHEWSCVLCDWCEVSGCDTLRALALPYADDPDFREEWR